MSSLGGRSPSPHELPRVVIAAPASGQGKTTIATGLMAALREEGLAVAGFKVGPDYIDPGYHALATGRPGRNLDPFLCGEALVEPLLLHGAAIPSSADVAVIEGVMGLFDGQVGGRGFASTAHVATLTRSPIVLVLDVSHASRTAAALVHGLATFDPAVRLSGVILNKAASPRHAAEVREALEATDLPVLGSIPRSAEIEVPSRHLGLVPAGERHQAAAVVDALARRIAEHVDLHAVLAVARTAPGLTATPWSPPTIVPPPGPRPVVALAGGRAFTFRYAETEELLYAAGLAPTVFDPLRDTALPDGTAGLYLGGGFPEVHAAELSANATLRGSIRTAVLAGLPTVAECAGLLYLCRSVDGHDMVGVLPGRAVMTPSLTLGYRTVVAAADSLVAAAGTRVSGHEFHRTTITVDSSPARGKASDRTDPAERHTAAWWIDGREDGFALDPAGTGQATVHASYLHTHWAGHLAAAMRFADAVHSYRRKASSPGKASSRREATSRRGASSPHQPEPGLMTSPDLHHHGDRDALPGLVDLAVNVRLQAPPPWLAEVITATLPGLGSYPDPADARDAIAQRHGLPPTCVLPTSGGAEAFSLIARGIPCVTPLVVHPQFTEPEAALRAAQHRPRRHLLTPASDFTLDPDFVDPTADLVVIGNPTNPTGRLHPAASLAALRRPGRVLVVDEAFMDAVPGEPESLLGRDLTGLLVIRSLTKTWGLAGLRAGYVVGDPELVARLQAVQPPWSVSSPAVAAMVACCSDRAGAEAAAAALELESHREVLARELTAVGLPPVPHSAAPFVLVDTASLGPESLRGELAERGFAVRRGETFPGLGPTWIRVAVRAPEVSAALARALAEIRRSRHAA